MEYLENKNTAYINTGICIGNTTGAYIDMEYDTKTDMIVFGGQRTPNRTDVNPLNGGFEMSMNTIYKFSNVPVGRHVAKYNYKNDRQLVIDDQSKELTDTATFTNERAAYLFAAPWSNTAPSYTYVGKVYRAIITQGNAVVRDFIPCINPDGECGMYDMVGKQFYGNANSTGNFNGEEK